MEFIQHLPVSINLLLFLVAAIVTWGAGITLAKTTLTLDTRWKIGEALGGLILLGIAGSLPEIAVVASAAHYGHFPVIIGTLIGGIAIQTLLLVIFDFATGPKHPLSYLAGTVTMSVEMLFAIVITVLVLLGTFVPAHITFLYANPMSWMLVVTWVVGLFVINKVRKYPKFNETEEEAHPGRKHHQRRAVENHVFFAGKSTLQVGMIFLVASIITLFAGWMLEESGAAVANAFHIGEGLFAATVIAFATALPEISTGLESIFIGDNQLAISDIAGGNAFMLVIFLLGDLVARKSVLSTAGQQDRVWAWLGIFMMAIYAISFVKRLKRCYFRLGFDSILQIVLYAGGLVVLTYIVK
ncbi:MAG: sodium:calcium antiporter [bacterium]